jgi:hypothetical protein
MSSVRDILEAIRALPRPERLRLAEQLKQELAEVPVPERVPDQSSPRLEQRGRLLVYTGPIDSSAFDHRLDREERVDELIARLNADRV